MLKNLHYVKNLGLQCKEALETGSPKRFGELMHEHWDHKKRRTGGMSNPQIGTWGETLGRWWGRFLLFYASDRNKLRHAMTAAGLQELIFLFDFEGTKVVLS